MQDTSDLTSPESAAVSGAKVHPRSQQQGDTMSSGAINPFEEFKRPSPQLASAVSSAASGTSGTSGENLPEGDDGFVNAGSDQIGELVRPPVGGGSASLRVAPLNQAQAALARSAVPLPRKLSANQVLQQTQQQRGNRLASSNWLGRSAAGAAAPTAALQQQPAIMNKRPRQASTMVLGDDEDEDEDNANEDDEDGDEDGDEGAILKRKQQRSAAAKSATATSAPPAKKRKLSRRKADDSEDEDEEPEFESDEDEENEEEFDDDDDNSIDSDASAGDDDDGDDSDDSGFGGGRRKKKGKKGSKGTGKSKKVVQKKLLKKKASKGRSAGDDDEDDSDFDFSPDEVSKPTQATTATTRSGGSVPMVLDDGDEDEDDGAIVVSGRRKQQPPSSAAASSAGAGGGNSTISATSIEAQARETVGRLSQKLGMGKDERKDLYRMLSQALNVKQGILKALQAFANGSGSSSSTSNDGEGPSSSSFSSSFSSATISPADFHNTLGIGIETLEQQQQQQEQQPSAPSPSSTSLAPAIEAARQHALREKLQLKPHQQIGVNWLYLLFQRHTSGVLADAMGLGKTLQSILLASLLTARAENAEYRLWLHRQQQKDRATASGRETEEALKAACKAFPDPGITLIVTPASTVGNWCRELAKWAPHLRVGLFKGGTRRGIDVLPNRLLNAMAAADGGMGSAEGQAAPIEGEDEAGDGVDIDLAADDSSDDADNAANSSSSSSGSSSDDDDDDEEEEESEDEELAAEEAARALTKRAAGLNGKAARAAVSSADDGADSLLFSPSRFTSRVTDILVTSYTVFDKESESARFDRTFLKHCGPFGLVILDEGHAIKNQNSSRYKHIMSLSKESRMRMLLSGTPINNDIKELLALLRFVGGKAFQGLSDETIETLETQVMGAKGDKSSASSSSSSRQEVISLLQNICEPFILRRRKEDVALGLPPKTDTTLPFDMTEEQRRVYEIEASKAKKAVGIPTPSVPVAPAVVAPLPSPTAATSVSAPAVTTTSEAISLLSDDDAAAASKGVIDLSEDAPAPAPVPAAAAASAGAGAGRGGRRGKAAAAASIAAAAGSISTTSNSSRRTRGSVAAGLNAAADNDNDDAAFFPSGPPSSVRSQTAGFSSSSSSSSASGTFSAKVVGNIFSDLRKGAQHPLLLLTRRFYGDDARRRRIAAALHRMGAFGAKPAADGSTSTVRPLALGDSYSSSSGGSGSTAGSRRSGAASSITNAGVTVDRIFQELTEEESDYTIHSLCVQFGCNGYFRFPLEKATGASSGVKLPALAPSANASAFEKQAAKMRKLLFALDSGEAFAVTGGFVEDEEAIPAFREQALRGAGSHDADDGGIGKNKEATSHASLLRHVVKALEAPDCIVAAAQSSASSSSSSSSPSSSASSAGGGGGGDGGKAAQDTSIASSPEIEILPSAARDTEPEIFRTVADAQKYLQSQRLPISALVRSSAKFVFLAEKLPQLVAQGHRILLFSQWTTILDLLADLCDALRIRCLRLDGSTPVVERQAIIDRFNNGAALMQKQTQLLEEATKSGDASESSSGAGGAGVLGSPNTGGGGASSSSSSSSSSRYFPVFLLSTRAGGLGLNLTASDTVIVYDSDLNPHVDSQAIDRSHRIGQTRPVTVMRLVTKGTVDETIVKIAERKAALDAALSLSASSKPGTNLAGLGSAFAPDPDDLDQEGDDVISEGAKPKGKAGAGKKGAADSKGAGAVVAGGLTVADILRQALSVA